MITSFSTIFRSWLQLKTENALNGFETLKPISHIFNLMTGRIQCPWYKFVRSNTTIAKRNSTVLVSAGRTSAPLYHSSWPRPGRPPRTVYGGRAYNGTRNKSSHSILSCLELPHLPRRPSHREKEEKDKLLTSTGELTCFIKHAEAYTFLTKLFRSRWLNMGFL